MKTTYIGILISFLLLTATSFAQYNVDKMDEDATIKKYSTLLYLINNFYTDTLNMNEVTENALIQTLKELDPHSSYIPADEVEEANEPLEGSFEGVGLTFQIYKDTVLVISPVPGGPSDKVGILAGDKIILVDGQKAYGEDINSEWVMSHLRGKKGTLVEVMIYRKGMKNLLDYTIVRDEIPLNSVDASFMLDNKTGYIKLNRFARNSQTEFTEAVVKLKNQGMQNLVFDLRGNSGGYLGTAMSISDDFLKEGQLIVYTEGAHNPRQDMDATVEGFFEQGKLVVLINEGSASASEIVSGAVQDWDRGMIIGRRSFGKGLVQRPFQLPDGSVVRLTVARYYTPSGRSIQKPYDDGTDEYYKDFYNRYEHGEMIHLDSIHFPDSLKYETKNGRTVYGGGGIMPDIFVPLDSSRYNQLYSNLIRKGVFNGFVNDYLNDNRKALNKKYPAFKDFNANFSISTEEFDVFINNAKKEDINISDEDLSLNGDFYKLQIKAMMARNLYETGSYFEVLSPIDNEIKKALEVMGEEEAFQRMGIPSY
jgi:carboxyl-terminal processing protease